MTKYVALLRAINVGGNNIIKMNDLKEEFEKIGFENVKTYIQSGNVLFESKITNKEKIEKTIEKALSNKFMYSARVIIRNQLEMENTIVNFPKIFENENWKHNICFLSNAIDSKNIITQFEIKKEIEEISYSMGVIFWSAKTEFLTKSTMIKLSSKKEYKEMTIRNINTTKKILELMN